MVETKFITIVSPSIGAAPSSFSSASTPTPSARLSTIKANAASQAAAATYAAASADANAMLNEFQVSPETAALINNMPASFTAAGTTYGGIDMANLDGPAGMMANAFNFASQNNALQAGNETDFTQNLLGAHITEEDNEDLFAGEGFNRIFGGQTAFADDQRSFRGAAGNSMGYQLGHPDNADVNGKATEPGKAVQPMLSETKQGRAFIKEVHRGQ